MRMAERHPVRREKEMTARVWQMAAIMLLLVVLRIESR